jgi:uridylate kinase
MKKITTGKTIIISLGGSIIVPDSVDIKFLKDFKNAIEKFVKKGNRAVIVCGGGGLNKKYNSAAKSIGKISDNDLDWLGIAATKLNAELLRALFGKMAHETIISNPTLTIKTSKKIIIASGWKPGWSTDYDAVMLASKFGAKKVYNFTNTDHVYDSDPRKNKNAKMFEQLRWKDYLAIVGKKWSPRLSTPFDPMASQLAMKNGIGVYIIKGSIKNITAVLAGKNADGTILHNVDMV